MNVIDAKNISYEVLGKLGEGSQSATYLLRDKQHIVKIFNKNLDDTTTKAKINFLENLGLDKNVFAIPLSQIVQPTSGYISEFTSGMIAISTLKLSEGNADPVKLYQSTGGLLKRYKVLIRLTAILRSLHNKGLAYCDFSPNSIFISEMPNNYNVFLIDLDNLKYKTSIFHNIYTPCYGAPEVITNDGTNTTMSDSFSFAVLAYELLTLVHPLTGDLLSKDEPELKVQALTGKLPWVEQSEDLTNKRSSGFSSEKVMPKKLLNLFKKNFDAGLNNPIERPSMAEWFEVLSLSLNELLNCGNANCRSSYPFNNFNRCTFCSFQPKKVIRIQMRRWEEITYLDENTHEVNQKFCLLPAVYEEILMDENTTKEISASNFLLTGIEPLIALLKIEQFVDDKEIKILLTPLKNTRFNITSRLGLSEGGKSIVLDSPKKISVVNASQHDKLKYMLHINDLNASQRVLTID